MGNSAKSFRALGLLLVSLLLPACNVLVQLKVDNQTDLDQVVSVKPKDASGYDQPQIEMGTVKSKQQSETSFQIEKGGQVKVLGCLKGSAQVFEDTFTVPASASDPYSKTESLSVDGKYLDDANAQKTIQSAFQNLGREFGFRPLATKNAVDTQFGSVCLVVPGPKATDKPEISQILPPGAFSDQSTVADIIYNSTTSRQSIKISSSASAAMSVSCPLYGSLGITSDTSSVYQVDWEMSGYGFVTKKEKAGWTFLEALSKLSPNLKAELFKVLQAKKDKGAICLYVNKLYLVRRAVLTKKQGEHQDFGAKLSVGSVLTANGAYSFDRSQEETYSYDDVALNIEGETFTLAAYEVKPDGTSVPATSVGQALIDEITALKAILIAVPSNIATIAPATVDPKWVLDVAEYKTLRIDR